MERILSLQFTIGTPSFNQDEQVGEVCIANISPRERAKRTRFAIVQLTLSLIALAVLIFLNVNPIWRLLLLFMFWPATISYFEARDKTCVAHALANTRRLGDVTEKVQDRAESKQIGRQSRKVILKGFYAAALLTMLAWVLPL